MKSIIYACIIMIICFFTPLNSLKHTTELTNSILAIGNTISSKEAHTNGVDKAENYGIDAIAVLILFISYCFVAVTLRSRNPILRTN